jgi:hypothetical protein
MKESGNENKPAKASIEISARKRAAWRLAASAGGMAKWHGESIESKRQWRRNRWPSWQYQHQERNEESGSGISGGGK